ncbi:glucan phosphoethanolaminetransferase (alkaline phosphatase superfamily) [Anaerosolibacter carboniphilus]|uniref:Glucan phosphoethanolaminetransferase (Alkaline phosphatase superfamily) n=1 Tax=Anaerosolibacter carboniphilus TaxID=1417629 RepID=A0A841KYS7_9FIRM|nr:hypothetical protein [Anaerosolibacter carboniphilus]MBB6218641.1 glucan phosphoethanolaminetransferase (alkaline phosphatase superfamily) [Anaerosolibacter carboniphilus]
MDSFISNGIKGLGMIVVFAIIAFLFIIGLGFSVNLVDVFISLIEETASHAVDHIKKYSVIAITFILIYPIILANIRALKKNRSSFISQLLDTTTFIYNIFISSGFIWLIIFTFGNPFINLIEIMRNMEEKTKTFIPVISNIIEDIIVLLIMIAMIVLPIVIIPYLQIKITNKYESKMNFLVKKE